MSKLRVLDLFSGVGAYSLGLERTGGFETVAFCEIEAYPRKILRKHWPHVPIYENVEQLTGDRLRADGIVPDWIVAGWPCQDISSAGTGRGLDGERSGLWEHIARLAGEIRPAGLLLENSSNLLVINGGRDFGRVLGDLAALGYDAEWHCLSAAAFDAPHIRDRLWIVAVVANAECSGPQGPGKQRGIRPVATGQRQAGESVHGREVGASDGLAAYANSIASIGASIARTQRNSWLPEPAVGRVASGVANGMDRIRCLGNLNPPIIPETIGRAILEALT